MKTKTILLLFVPLLVASALALSVPRQVNAATSNAVKPTAAAAIGDCDKTSDAKACKSAFQACGKDKSKSDQKTCETGVIQEYNHVTNAGDQNNAADNGDNNAGDANAANAANGGNAGDANQCATNDTTCSDPAADPSASCNREGCDLVKNYINPFIKVLSISVGVIAASSLILGGIQYSASEGDPQKVTAAKNRISKTIFALISYTFLWAFLQFLIPGGVF